MFITQDALPAADTWLQNFIDAMKLDERIAGGFGIHYPYPDCNLLDVRDLANHSKASERRIRCISWRTGSGMSGRKATGNFLAFFSDNNACLRRSVWEKYPYEDVNFAEDQFWARKMIELGYGKVYCPYAPVYHSHNIS